MYQFIPRIRHAAILFHGEGFSAAGTVDIGFLKDCFHHIGRNAAGFHRICEDFAALAEAHLDEAEEELSILHTDRRLLTATDLEYCRRDLRARDEGGRRDVDDALYGAVELDRKCQRAVVLRARRGQNAVCHFLLHPEDENPEEKS